MRHLSHYAGTGARNAGAAVINGGSLALSTFGAMLWWGVDIGAGFGFHFTSRVEVGLLAILSVRWKCRKSSEKNPRARM